MDIVAIIYNMKTFILTWFSFSMKYVVISTPNCVEGKRVLAIAGEKEKDKIIILENKREDT